MCRSTSNLHLYSSIFNRRNFWKRTMFVRNEISAHGYGIARKTIQDELLSYHGGKTRRQHFVLSCIFPSHYRVVKFHYASVPTRPIAYHNKMFVRSRRFIILKFQKTGRLVQVAPLFQGKFWRETCLFTMQWASLKAFTLTPKDRPKTWISWRPLWGRKFGGRR